MPPGHALPYVQHSQKVLPTKQRTRTTNLSRETRKANAENAEAKRTRIWEDLQNYWRAQEVFVQELAEKHSKSLKWMKDAIQCVSKYGAKQRAVSRHNAFIHAQSLEINTDMPPGKKADAIALQHAAASAGSWRDVPEEEMLKMIASLEAKRALVKKGIRAKPLSQLATVRQVHRRMENEERLMALGQSCKTLSFCVTVRTSPQHLNAPMFAADSIAKDFIEIVLGWDMNEFCLKYESFALFRLKGMKMNNNDKAVMTRRRVHGMVTRDLRSVTGNPSLDMSWVNFEEDIVDQYRVVLDGWPNMTFNPASLGYKGLEQVLEALEQGRCKFRQLTNEEYTMRKDTIAAVGGSQKKVRKGRSDKGKKRGPRGGSKKSGNCKDPRQGSSSSQDDRDEDNEESEV